MSQGNKYNDRIRDDYIPPNRKMMLLCKQKDKWIAAEEDELRSFAVNNVMTKNPRLPDNGKALPLKWIYTIKKDHKGVIIRYKARLVVQGFFQIFGVDYTFFFLNRFNLAKGLKATQVHNSDTPSLSHRDWWGSGQ